MQMMDLKKYTPETLERVKMCLCENPAVVRLISEFQTTFGYKVKVVKGRKVKHGVVGRCFWMGSHSYAKYEDYWGQKTVTRIGIRDDAGCVYWTSLDNVEVIPDTYEAPAEAVKKYDKVYRKLTARPLYGMTESPKLREARESAENACDRYNTLRNWTEELMDKEREMGKAGQEDEELSLMIDDALDEEDRARKNLEILEQEYRKVWDKEIFCKSK